MSFTLYHVKSDGTRKPIKISIFDALRGVPDRASRKQRTRNNTMCSCCGKVHAPKEAAKDSKDDTKGENQKTKPKNNGKKKNSDEETDDQIILRMKADNPSAPWAEILAVTTSFKSAGEVKARFKEIQHQDAQGKPDQSKVTKEKDLDLDKEGRAAKNREEGLKKQAEEKAKKEAEGKAEKEKAGPPKDNEKNEKANPTERDKTGSGSVSSKKKWQIIASKHYDKTGKRISIAQARQMAEAK